VNLTRLPITVNPRMSGLLASGSSSPFSHSLTPGSCWPSRPTSQHLRLTPARVPVPLPNSHQVISSPITAGAVHAQSCDATTRHQTRPHLASVRPQGFLSRQTPSLLLHHPTRAPATCPASTTTVPSVGHCGGIVTRPLGQEAKGQHHHRLHSLPGNMPHLPNQHTSPTSLER
jgi:hypothetical protein